MREFKKHTPGRTWSAYHDEERSQWQVVDGARVVATGIESEADAVALAAAPDLLAQRDQLAEVLRDCRSRADHAKDNPRQQTDALFDILESCDDALRAVEVKP